MKEELAKLKHARSAQQYPEIDLKDDEYVVLAMKRTDLGVTGIWAFVVFCIILLSVLLIALSGTEYIGNLNATAIHYLWMLIILFYCLIVFGGFIAKAVYTSNRMYITNLRAIQHIRISVFGRSTQIIELAKIEDVSFHQKSLVENLFHIGTLRMSTMGDETTYTFPYLDTPRDEVETISELVCNARHIPKKKQGKEERTITEKAPESTDTPETHEAPAIPQPSTAEIDREIV